MSGSVVTQRQFELVKNIGLQARRPGCEYNSNGKWDALGGVGRVSSEQLSGFHILILL